MRSTFSHGTEYSRCYTDMRGVDFTGDGGNISPARFACLENMYRDYDGEGAGLTESVPGYRRVTALGAPIYSIHRQKTRDGDILILHAGTSLYRLPVSRRDDPSTMTPIAAVAARRSTAYQSGTSLYVLDRERMVRIAKDGAVTVLENPGEDEEDTSTLQAYIPTTYVTGEEHEQRNLLSSKFREEYLLTVPEERAYATPGLLYRILDEAAGYCAVTGYAGTEEAVSVPRRVRIGEKSFEVTDIADRAFLDAPITSVRVGDRVQRVGKLAFSGCTALTKVILSDSVTLIDNGAFNNCAHLTDLYLGAGLTKIGLAPFASCVSLTTVRYAGTEEEYSAIENTEVFTGLTLVYDTRCDDIAVSIPLFDPALSVESVRMGETDLPFRCVGGEELCRAVVIEETGIRALTGQNITVVGTLAGNTFSKTSSGSGVLEGQNEYTGTGISAILGCTVSECFDGRIFLSGNPDLPNTVFYSGRDLTGENNPTYFGILNYCNDGVGAYPVRALLAAGGYLAVFKSGDDGNGSVYLHAPQATGQDLLPKIYPTAYVHAGIAATGDAFCYLDDPVFLSPLGLCALEKQAINLERSIACRSHPVNPRLLTEDPDAVRLTEWCGYLVAAAGEKLYLADARQTFTHPTGNREYEWYFLTGVGSRSGAERVYRYAATPPREGYAAPVQDGRAEGTVYSEVTEEGETVYYTVGPGSLRYEVYPTEEWRGGVLSPVLSVLGVGALLFFGTEAGVLCVFNNDKRGVPPPALANSGDFDPAEYQERMGRRLHPYYYSFDGFAPRYVLRTARDNCGIPHMCKDTVRHSLTVKCRSYTDSRLTVEVGTDRSGYTEVTRFPGTSLTFAELDFTALTLAGADAYTLSLREKERLWVEKQITVYSDEFQAPIGVYSIGFRYTVRGRVRNR